MLGNPREHVRTNLLVLVECKDVIGPTDPLQDPVRPTRLTLDAPADPQKGSQDSPGFGGWPPTHGVTAKTPAIEGTGSPWSSRSARTLKERD